MNKIMLVFISLHATSALAAPCPHQITLKDAAFINHEQFPTPAQIETNFNQTFVTFGTVIWDSPDLAGADRLVTAIESQYNQKSHSMELTPTWSEADQQCEGTLGGLKYAFDGAIEFDLSSPDNWPDTATIYSTPTHAEVEYDVDFPSNCSGCPRSTELFEFSEVSVTQ